MRTSPRPATLTTQNLNPHGRWGGGTPQWLMAALAGFAGVVLACVSCASPERRAHQEANYRARFERTSSIRMTEVGAAHPDVTRHQFLPGAKVELYVSYFTRGEQVGFRVENEDGTTILVSGDPGARSTRSSVSPDRPQLAYPVEVRHGQDGGVIRVDLPVQYSNRNLPGQPPTPSAGGFAHFTATFECPTVPGRYLVVLDCSDVPSLERLKTYPFSIVAMLPSDAPRK